MPRPWIDAVSKVALGSLCTVAGVLLPCLLPAEAGTGDPAQVAVLHNGVRDDHSYNHLILKGVRAFERQRQVPVLLIEDPGSQLYPGDSFEQLLARIDGAGIGALIFDGLNLTNERAAKAIGRHPQLRLVDVNGGLSVPDRVRAVDFRIEEAAYLAGLLAARHSRSGTLGFVGGLDVPMIRSFGCAYAAGARQQRPEIRVLQRSMGFVANAFSDPASGHRLAMELIDAGADVVFHAAGATGLGVLQAVAERDVLGIGVDTNQNPLHPGHVLTSVMKHLDVVIYSNLVALHEGGWAPGVASVGLAERAVGLAMDQHNFALLDATDRQILEDAEFDIIAGVELFDLEQLRSGHCPHLEPAATP